MQEIHKTVLREETIKNLVMNKEGIYIDGTIGFAGHAELILKINENGKLIGIDLDSYALKHVQKQLV